MTLNQNKWCTALWFLALADIAAAGFISGNMILPALVIAGTISARFIVWRTQNPFDSIAGKIFPFLCICAATVPVWHAKAALLFNAVFLLHLFLMLGYWRLLRNLPWLQTANMISGVAISSACFIVAGDNKARIISAFLISLLSTATTWLMPYILRPRAGMRNSPLLTLCLVLVAAFCTGYIAGPPLALISAKSIPDPIKSNKTPGTNQFLPRNIPDATVGMESPNNKNQENYPTAFLKIIPPDVSKLKSFYLRNAGYSHFDGRRWTFESFYKNEISDMDDGKRDGWTRISPKANEEDIPYMVFLPDFSNPWVPVLPDSTKIKIPTLSMGENNSLTVKTLRGGYVSYESKVAISGIQLPDIESFGEPEDPDSLPLYYVQLPEGNFAELNFAEKIRILSKEIVGEETDPEVKLHKITKFFKNEFKYELPPPGTKASSLSDFIFRTKKGHCTLFATAFAMMLRAEQIPARLGFGYCGGAYDTENDVFVFHRNDAHAWTEVCFKGKGWKIVNVTPVCEQDPGIAPPGEFSEIADLFKELEPSTTSEPISIATSKSERLKEMLLSSLPFLLFSIFLLGVSAYSIIRTGASGNVTPNLAGEEENKMPFFKVFCLHFATRNNAVKRRSQTAREFLQMLKSRRILKDEFDDLVAYYYRVKYEGEKPSSKTEDSFIHRIAKLNETPPTT